MKDAVISAAMSRIRQSLAACPAAIVTIGVAAGMSPQDAKAWGDYEYLGRSVGAEVARAATGTSRAGPLLSVVGSAVGSALGKPLDEAAQAKAREEEALRRAREQAQRDDAYDRERQRLNPAYVTYGDLSQRSTAATAAFDKVGSNIRDLQQQQDRLVQDYERRNRR